MSELLEMEAMLSQENDEFIATETAIQEHFERLEDAIQNGNNEAAAYYLGELNELCDVSEINDKQIIDEEISFGSKEKDDLKRKLENAKSSYRHAEKALNTLLNDKAHGMKGVDPAISDRKYQLKSFAREISQLQRQISQMKE